MEMGSRKMINIAIGNRVTENEGINTYCKLLEKGLRNNEVYNPIMFSDNKSYVSKNIYQKNFELL